MTGLSSIHIGGDVGGQIALADQVIALDEVIGHGLPLPLRTLTPQAQLELIRLDGLERQRQLRSGQRITGIGGAPSAEELPLGRCPEAVVERGIGTERGRQRPGGPQLGAQMREIGLRSRLLSIDPGGRLGRGGGQRIAHVEAQAVGPQPCAHPHGRNGRELGVDVAGHALEHHLVVVDPVAHGVAGVGRVGARAHAREVQRVFHPGAGASVQVQPSHQAQAQRATDVVPPLGQQAQGLHVGLLDARV